MSERDIRAFSAIKQFVEALWEVYGNETVSPLALYRRLLEKITDNDTQSVQRFVGGFKTFFAEHEKAVLNNSLNDIPEGTCIYYGDKGGRIYIEIQKFLYRADTDAESRETIRSHLINVSREIEPSPLKTQELQKQMAQFAQAMKQSSASSNNDNAPEARLMQNLIGTLQENMGDIQNASNPMEAVMGMIANPALIEGITKTMAGFMAEQNGQIDPMKMMMNMAGMMQHMMPPQQSNVEAVDDDEDDEDDGVQGIPEALEGRDREALADIERQLESANITSKTNNKQD